MKKIKNILYFAFTCLIASTTQATELQSHRAYYDLNLADTTGTNNTILDVQGTLVVELQQTCDGWIIQQTSDSTIFSSSKTREHIRWGYTMWESLDHKEYRFSTYQKVDGQLTEESRGTASLNSLTATYTLPKSQTIPLSTTTLFPIAHLQELLKAAQAGKQHFSRYVFDGSTDLGEILLNSVIGSQQETEKKTYYPVQMAIFETSNKGMLPDYEVFEHLQSSGIASHYRIYYDGFSVNGTLKKVELLPAPAC